MLTITTLKWVPTFAQGYVRDLRLRWACEEAGIAYRTRLIDFKQMRSPEHLVEQPFGQVPTMQEGSLSLFESGAILLHLGEKSTRLLPAEPSAKARAVTWVFAAMNSVEPFVSFFNKCPPANAFRAEILAALKPRLKALSDRLSGNQFLEDNQFTIGDLLMACVLREIEAPGPLADFPVLQAYVNRCKDRPAFQKALSDQLKTHAANAPGPVAG